MRKYLLAIVGLVLLCLLAALGTASGSPDTITVDSTTDVLDADVDCDSVGIVDLPGPDTETSLREAICAANDNTGSDTIAFNIPVTDTGYEVSGITGTWTIPLASSLPILTDDSTIISGTTQAANQGDLNPDGPEIEISGAGVGSGDCLQVASAGNVIHGLVINRCPWGGVALMGSGATTNTVSGNYIGTDASGSTDLGNGFVGVEIRDEAQGNVVGGDTPEERNVISGNGYHGVCIRDAGTDGNTVSGNYIGADATGTQDLGNTWHGVHIEQGAQNNTVGGDTSGERNVISGNGRQGVSIYWGGTDGNTVSGNYIGTDVTGAEDRGNVNYGVAIYGGAQNNTVGGDTEGERNIISGNDSGGVGIEGSGTTSNTISGNFIGTVVSGTQALGNYTGVAISPSAQNNTVGGDTEGERNVISGNNIGVNIAGSGAMSNTVSGNYIGTDVTGAQDLGNAWDGVRIAGGAQNNTVGGDTSGERNVISGNDQIGVNIYLGGTDGNTVCGNYIGTDAGGTQELGNTGYGVLIEDGPQNNTVGGQTAGERNIISGNSWSGVHIKGDGTMSNTVSGNYIGTDVTGTQDKGNTFDGVMIEEGAQNNTVGGQTAGERNIISGNESEGVVIEGTGTMSNTVSGNYIGTIVTGTEELGNTSFGVAIQGGAQNNTVGGDTEGERNVISANSIGVSMSGSGTMSNTVSGNYIGTDASGSSPLGPAVCGVRISGGAQNNTVGGDNSGERNVISANDYGVIIYSGGTDGNTVSANYIGTDATGTQGLGNTYDGVLIEQGAQNNNVGGQTAGERNVISGNSLRGVYIKGAGTDGNTVSGNYIGTDYTGTQDKGNGRDGVRIDGEAQNNTVGPHNLIAHNEWRGVYVDDSDTTGNTITENSIHSNDLLGIDLNDGGNDDLPAPAISGILCKTITGTAPLSATVEIFTGPDEEGKTYLATALADGAGQWDVAGSFTFDSYLTATATDASGNTSEFSAQAAVEACYRVFLPLAMKRY